jgi:hypothetical protein
MIRRSTWVVFGVFVVVAAVAIWLLKSPTSPMPSGAQTPSPTNTPKLINGWDTETVVSLELDRPTAEAVRLVVGQDKSWINETKPGSIAPGKVDQLLAELFAAETLAKLPADYSLDSLGLVNTGTVILLKSADGKTMQVTVGIVTPTGSGYYVQLDENAPVVVGKPDLDAVIQLFDEAIPETPTPAVGQLPLGEATPTP